MIMFLTGKRRSYGPHKALMTMPGRMFMELQKTILAQLKAAPPNWPKA